MIKQESVGPAPANRAATTATSSALHRLERERAARGDQARRRNLEAAPAAVGTLLGRGPHLGPAEPGRGRIFWDKAEPEYLSAYRAIYRWMFAYADVWF